MRILFLSHRIPYPPNKGDKIRSFNILKHLAERHEIHLATLIDDPVDLQYIESLSGMVKSIHYDIIQPSRKKALSAFALLRNNPISVAYFFSGKLLSEIESLIHKTAFDVIFCSSSPMAEYLFRSKDSQPPSLPASQPPSFPASQLPGIPASRPLFIMDLIDVDSQKWRDYAIRSSFPMRWIYQKEAACLAGYESKIAAFFDTILLVSELEKKILRDSVPNGNVVAMPNGVDSDYFSPEFKSDFKKDGPVLTFTGVMDYWPNVEGVKWFVENVFPIARKSIPDLKLYIVGSRPNATVQALKSHAGVEITGYVDDVRHYLAAADVCVVPLRIARGIQNKVLEAFAMGMAVVCTSQAIQGINAEIGEDVLVSEDEADFSGSIVSLVNDRVLREKFGLNARGCVEKDYSWKKNLSLLDRMIEEGPGYRNKAAVELHHIPEQNYVEEKLN